MQSGASGLDTVGTTIAEDNLLPADFNRHSDFAWENYKSIILNLAKGKRVLEIGAGRAPLFSQEEIAEHNIDYFGNDIEEAELKRVDWLQNRAVFDICGPIPEEFHKSFDLIFSKMVLEHVPNGETYYANILLLLADGGRSLSFHPTLFSPPFVLNLLLPERLSSWLLKFFFPMRNQDEIPKFPALYKWCYSSDSMRAKIRNLGFEDVEIIDFYGTNYFEKMPLIRSLDQAFNAFCMKRRIRFFSSFAYTITHA